MEKRRTSLKINDVILQTISKIAVFIILTLGFYLFFSGSEAPGGGFVGGLVLASSLVLLFLAFDIETIRRSLPVNFKLVAGTGAAIVVLTGMAGVLFGEAFLTQSLLSLTLPIYGSIEFSTVTIFEIGVALTVVGVVVTIILSIAEDG